jgi:hypothetical protein
MRDEMETLNQGANSHIALAFRDLQTPKVSTFDFTGG